MEIEFEKLTARIPKSIKIGLERKAKADGEPIAVVIRGLLRTGLQQEGYLPAQPARVVEAIHVEH